MIAADLCANHNSPFTLFCLDSKCSNRLGCSDCMAELHNNHTFVQNAPRFVSISKLQSGDPKSLLHLVGLTNDSIAHARSEQEAGLDSKILDEFKKLQEIKFNLSNLVELKKETENKNLSSLMTFYKLESVRSALQNVSITQLNKWAETLYPNIRLQKEQEVKERFALQISGVYISQNACLSLFTNLSNTCKLFTQSNKIETSTISALAQPTSQNYISTTNGFFGQRYIQGNAFQSTTNTSHPTNNTASGLFATNNQSQLPKLQMDKTAGPVLQKILFAGRNSDSTVGQNVGPKSSQGNLFDRPILEKDLGQPVTKQNDNLLFSNSFTSTNSVGNSIGTLNNSTPLQATQTNLVLTPSTSNFQTYPSTGLGISMYILDSTKVQPNEFAQSKLNQGSLPYSSILGASKPFEGQIANPSPHLPGQYKVDTIGSSFTFPSSNSVTMKETKAKETTQPIMNQGFSTSKPSAAIQHTLGQNGFNNFQVPKLEQATNGTFGRNSLFTSSNLIGSKESQPKGTTKVLKNENERVQNDISNTERSKQTETFETKPKGL